MIGQLAGYYMIYTPTRSRGVKIALDLIKAGRDLKTIPANEKIVSLLKKAWVKNGVGELIAVEVMDDKSILYKVRDVCCSIEAVGSKYCSLAAVLCGQAEALTDLTWCGELLGCQHLGEPYCCVKIKPGNEKLVGSDINENELSKLTDSIVESIVEKKPRYPRRNLGDDFHFSLHQMLNYLMLTPSPGHAILSKHSGVLVGERIAEKAGLSGRDAVFDYARDLFSYLKAGILHEPVGRGGRFFLQMDESVYASGVNNIHMKLDVFLAGIIEGMLNLATEEKWRVEETKCLANGDELCEFECKNLGL